MICEIVKAIEDELYDVLEMNPTVKGLETFIKKNSKDLHSKHYLNLIGIKYLIQKKKHSNFLFQLKETSSTS